MYKHYYSHFLKSHGPVLHFASHSHHFWPDISREAHLQYWDDSSRWADLKWERFFSEKVPAAQNLIAGVLNLANPSQIVFAQSTHELVFRMLTSLDWSKKNQILTTDSEFYSFDRQINRLSELGSFEISKVPTLEFVSFEDRFVEQIKKQKWDFIFLSHVFFNSGYVCDIEKILDAVPENTLVVIDGYHGFMAVPTDFSKFQEKCFYLAGSYKYAQGGEGACFLYVPPATRHRPFYTGWFAELSKLSSVGTQVGYPENSFQYAGSTMDMSALYRLVSVLEFFKQQGLSVEKIHSYIRTLQSHFLKGLMTEPHAWIRKENLVVPDLSCAGHFLSFEAPSVEECQRMVTALKDAGVLVDSRKRILRFGFGLYQEPVDIDVALQTLQSC